MRSCGFYIGDDTIDTLRVGPNGLRIRDTKTHSTAGLWLRRTPPNPGVTQGSILSSIVSTGRNYLGGTASTERVYSRIRTRADNVSDDDMQGQIELQVTTGWDGDEVEKIIAIFEPGAITFFRNCKI